MPHINLPIPDTIEALSPDNLFGRAPRKQPILYIDRSIITDRYNAFKSIFGAADIHYAMKCNPHEAVLQHVKKLGGNFEIASYAELEMLQKIGVDPRTVLYSNPVKSSRDIQSAYNAGVRCFAFQSEDELHKFAALGASDIKVYVRLATTTRDSTVASEAKFGQSAYNQAGRAEVVKLLELAQSLGLEPYGIAFHVGSQMEDPEAWTRPIRAVGVLMRQLSTEGIRLSMLDIGGGFPAYHNVGIPPLLAFGEVIMRELAALPYPLKKIAIEPGRALVSDAGALVVEVYGNAQRGDQQWLYVNVGAFNGLMEALETDTALHFPMIDERHAAKKIAYIISGPSCDSQDTVAVGQMLSDDLREGDRVIIYTTGAYTTAYASHFNGFLPPTVEMV